MGLQTKGKNLSFPQKRESLANVEIPTCVGMTASPLFFANSYGKSINGYNRPILEI